MIEEILGKTLKEVDKSEESIWFIFDDGSEYEMKHIYDYNETIWLEEIYGDLESLVGQEITEVGKDVVFSYTEYQAEERTTFTINKVKIPWLAYGTGEYSLDISFNKIRRKK